jgi:hypothetical protein
MVHVLIRHKVADYNRWKEAFDSNLASRKRAGETGSHVYNVVDHPHDIVVQLHFQTIEEARKFMSSDELTRRLRDSGVEGNLDVQYLEDARAVHRTAAD